MTRPFSPLALAALAAVPLSPAHASLASTSTPSFTCSGADPGLGGTVSWFGDAVSAFPELAVLGGAATPLDCSGGSFSEPVARKSGEGQKDFLKVTMKEVFITSLPPTDNTKKWSEVRNLLGEVVDGKQTYETYWNIFDEYPVNGNSLATRSSFIGFKFSTVGQFTG